MFLPVPRDLFHAEFMRFASASSVNTHIDWNGILPHMFYKAHKPPCLTFHTRAAGITIHFFGISPQPRVTQAMAVDNTPSICFGLQAAASTSAKPINIYWGFFFLFFFFPNVEHKLQSHHTLMAVCGPVHTLSVSPCQRGAVSSVAPGLYQMATFAALLLTQHTAVCQLAFFFVPPILAFPHLVSSPISPSPPTLTRFYIVFLNAHEE